MRCFGPTGPRVHREGRENGPARLWRALVLCGALLGLPWRAGPAHGDELRLVTGDRISGIVLNEGATGVWIEVAPYVAVFYDYDRIARAKKASAEENAGLFKRPAAPPHLPPEVIAGRVVLKTSAGEWVLVKPRLAVLVDPARRLATAPPRSTDGPRDDEQNRRRQALQQLYEKPEPLSPAQVTHRLGPPSKRLRQGGERQWLYDLGAAGVAIVRFREGKLDYVDMLPAEAATE